MDGLDDKNETETENETGADQTVVPTTAAVPRRPTPSIHSLGSFDEVTAGPRRVAGLYFYLQLDCLVDLAYRYAGQTRGKLRRLPPVLLRAIGLVDPTMRELVEMQYQFEEPFVVDSAKISNKLGLEATPLDEAVAATLQEYRHD